MKKASKIFAICLILCSIAAFVVGLVGGIGIYRDTSQYRTYDPSRGAFVWNALSHTYEGTIALVGTFLIIVAIVFFILTFAVDKKHAFLFSIGSAASLFISTTMQLFAAQYYLSYDKFCFQYDIVYIARDWYNNSLASGIICAILLVFTIVFLIVNAVLSAKSLEVAPAINPQNSIQSTFSVPQPISTPTLSFEEGMAQINYFYELFAAGILTEQEFADQKARIFSNMGIEKQ